MEKKELKEQLNGFLGDYSDLDMLTDYVLELLDKAREEVRREVLKEVEYTLAKDTRYEFRFTEIKEVLSKLKDNK